MIKRTRIGNFRYVMFAVLIKEPEEGELCAIVLQAQMCPEAHYKIRNE